MIRELIRATKAARVRLSDGSIGTRVEQGRFQVVRVTYRGSKSTVTEVSGWLPIADVVTFLDKLS